jgi:antitoxin (DNA-binding transcriptional repressor) of toxin-antitoxin stability system
MQSIAVSELRENLMKILKDIEHGSSLDITSRGRVVAKLVPPNFTRKLARKKLIEIGKKAKINDVISPIDEKWEANN